MKLSKTQSITTNAFLCAIVLLFVLVPIPIHTIQLAFIPLVAIIISAEFIGLKNGIFTGLFFGIVSLISSFLSPTSLLYFAFQNPAISILPRVLIGVSAYYATKGFKKFFPKAPDILSYASGSLAGVLTNTIGVLGLILVFYHGKTLNNGTALNWQFISAIIVSNSIIEIIICTIVTPPIVVALKKAFRIN